MNSTEYLNQMYKLKFINRYSNRVRIHNESVAAHSFFVSAIILGLADEYYFKLEDALVAAVSHDILESETCDITHNLKTEFPTLDKELSAIERLKVKRYPAQIQRGFKIFNSTAVEGEIARLADAMQVAQYCVCEIALGNTLVDEILEESLERIKYHRKELKAYERIR